MRVIALDGRYALILPDELLHGLLPVRRDIHRLVPLLAFPVRQILTYRRFEQLSCHFRRIDGQRNRPALDIFLHNHPLLPATAKHMIPHLRRDVAAHRRRGVDERFHEILLDVAHVAGVLVDAADDVPDVLTVQPQQPLLHQLPAIGIAAELVHSAAGAQHLRRQIDDLVHPLLRVLLAQ